MWFEHMNKISIKHWAPNHHHSWDCLNVCKCWYTQLILNLGASWFIPRKNPDSRIGLRNRSQCGINVEKVCYFVHFWGFIIPHTSIVQTHELNNPTKAESSAEWPNRGLNLGGCLTNGVFLPQHYTYEDIYNIYRYRYRYMMFNLSLI